MSILLIWCPNSVPHQLNRYALNLSTLTWFKMAGDGSTWPATTTVLGIPEKPFTVLTIHYPSYIENGGALLRLESLYTLSID